MPYKTDGSREYRAFGVPELAQQATGDGGSKAYKVRGYATTFDVPYDYGLDGVKEQVLSTALNGADMSDVIFQLNHEGAVLARTRNNTLTVTCDAHGLLVDADLSGSQQGRELYEAIANGLIDRMSWGFAVPADGWSWDEATRTSTIEKVTKVFDVSAVSIPADADTEIHARSYLDGVIEEERKEFARRGHEERERVALTLKLKTL